MAHPNRSLRLKQRVSTAKHARRRRIRLNDVFMIYRHRATTERRERHSVYDIWQNVISGRRPALYASNNHYTSCPIHDRSVAFPDIRHALDAVVTAAREDGRVSLRVGGARWKTGWSTYPCKGADRRLMDSEVVRRENIGDCRSI